MAKSIGNRVLGGALTAWAFAGALAGAQPAQASDASAIVARTVAALSKFETAAYHPVAPEKFVPVALTAIAEAIPPQPVGGSDCRTAARAPAMLPVVPTAYAPIAVALECAAIEGTDTAKLDAASDSAIDRVTAQFDADGSWLNVQRMTDLMKERGSGIGLTLKQTGEGALVIFAPDTAPGFLAGIRNGDHLVAIDGTPVAGRPLKDIIEALRGAAGSTVRIDIRHPKGAIEQLMVTRQTLSGPRKWIEIEQTSSTLRIRIVGMISGVAAQVKKEVTQRRGTFARIVFDLRQNAGGLLDETIMLADLFLPKAAIATIDDRDPGFREAYTSGSSEIAKGVPVDVWVDGVTASGAEIVAAALQDNKRARIYGETTAGIGRIATLLPIDKGHMLKLTTGSTLRAYGSELATHPVVPDCVTDPLTLSLDRTDCPIARSGA